MFEMSGVWASDFQVWIFMLTQSVPFQKSSVMSKAFGDLLEPLQLESRTTLLDLSNAVLLPYFLLPSSRLCRGPG